MARVALVDDDVSWGKLLCFEGICNLGSFVGGKRGQDGHFLQEALVHPSASKGRLHEDTTECDSVQSPQGATSLGRDDGCRTGSVVHESKLTEGATGLDAADLVAQSIRARLNKATGVDIDIKRASLDYVEIVTSISLADYLFVVPVSKMQEKGIACFSCYVLLTLMPLAGMGFSTRAPKICALCSSSKWLKRKFPSMACLSRSTCSGVFSVKGGVQLS